MSLPVEMFPLLSPSQISPVMTGMSQANQLYAQNMQNQYLQQNLQANLRKQQLANNISQAQANVAPQMNAAELAYKQAQTPNLNAATQYILGGQIPEAQAQAGYVGTMAGKNQFSLNNPATMLPGFAGQIGGLDTLRNMGLLNNGQSPNVAPPTQNANFVNGMSNGVPMRVPGIPSAGNISPGGQNGQIMPQNPYGAQPQNGQGQQDIAQGNNPGLMNYQDAQNLLLKGMTAPIEKNIAQSNYYQSRASGFNFQSLPPTEKSYMIAQAAGIGLPPLQGAAYFNNGGTLEQLAQQKGLDPNNLPTPLYAATPATVQLIQRRNQALNEINTIQPEITAGMSPYARQFGGYAPSQIADAIQNDNPDQQARFLAARALMPEMASLRLKAMGGNIGIEAIKEVNNQSMGNIKSFQSLVSPKVYTAAQNYVDDWINQGANAANKVGLAGSLGNFNTGGKPLTNSTMTGATQNSSAQNNSPVPKYAPNASVQMFAPNGEKITVLGSNVSEALKRGAKFK